MRPFDSEASSKMANRRFRRVVGGLRLWDIDNGPWHGPDQHHTARSFSLHEVPSYRGSIQVGAVHIDSPKFLDAIERIYNSIKIFRETSGGYQMVNLTMLTYNLDYRFIDRIWIWDIGIMRCDFGNAITTQCEHKTGTLGAYFSASGFSLKNWAMSKPACRAASLSSHRK